MEQGTASARHIFGAYEILETVGQGGMGVVYRAYDTVLRRVVALKILRDDLREQPHLVARFQREAEAFASLNHPNIVHIFSVGRVGRIPYLAMECIDGTPLSRILKAERRLPWERALEIAFEIAQALACAHRAQIIHRDIKPGNIIIGHDGHAYVTDFGIAKVLNAETQLTVDGARLGTPQYMSPERCQNKETTASSDIYSLGILLYQMIAGRLPFQSDTPVTLIHQIMVDAPPRLSTFCPGVPENVDRLVAYMIEKDPAARPASADFLCEIIERVHAGKPILDHDGERVETLRGYREAQTPTPTPAPNRKSSWWARHRAALRRRAGKVPWHSRGLWAIGLGVLAAGAGMASLHVGSRQNSAMSGILRLPDDPKLWQAAGPLATFVDEGPGIVTAEIDLDDFGVSDLVWAGTADTVAVRLSGRPNSPRAGLSAVVRVNLHRAEAELLAAPFAESEARVEIVGGGNGRVYGWLDTRPDTLLVWDASPRQPPTEVSLAGPPGVPSAPITRCSAVASTPFGDGILAAIQLGSSAWKVAGVAGTGTTFGPITTAGPVSALHWNATGEVLSYVVGRSNGLREVFVARAAAAEPESIAVGDLIPDTGTLNPDGTAVLVCHREGNARRITMISLEPGAPAMDLGEGGEADWTAAGNMVFSAPDNQGRTQLWWASAHSPGTREQRTYLSGGTSSICRAAPDRSSAISTGVRGARPVLVFARDLDR